MIDSIQIRRYRPEDIDAVYAAVMESRAELSPWMPWCHEHYSRRDTAGWVESREEAWESSREKSFIVVNGAGELLGTCGLHRFDIPNGTAEIGYWVRTSAARTGVATAATRRLCQWAFAETPLVRLEILASVENLPSQRVAEKAGAVREGVLRQRLILHGRRHDCVLSAILKDDFLR